MTASRRPRVLFVGIAYAGHTSRYMTLRANTARDARIHATYRIVEGWRDGGAIERIRVLPRPIRGRLRGVVSARAVAAFPRPDVTWSAANEVTVPWLWSQAGPLRRPLVLDLDATFDQMEASAPLYFKRAARTGMRLRVSRAMERAVWRNVTLFTPWSRWAADGLRAAGISDDRIRVLPPGVDLSFWHCPPRMAPADGRPVRLLFVGGDFVRKGGPLLIESLATFEAGRFELDIVTRDEVGQVPLNVRVHRAEAGSPLLQKLYGEADLFILPTRAECFGIAAVEALASGLPVLMGDVGGARDIVDHGENGWLTQPTTDGIRDALGRAWSAREHLPAMGNAARRKAVTRFDGCANDAELVELLCDQAARAWHVTGKR